jgi:hypothetical protein
VITKEQVYAFLLEACPSFQSKFDSFDEEYKELYFCIAGDFAYHLLHLHNANQKQEFATIVMLFERFEIEGDTFVRELSIIGFLEAIQNIWGNCGVNSDLEFLPLLLPATRNSWEKLNNFWNREN